MGFFDRLLGRGRYVEGTTPDSTGPMPESASDWRGTAPPENGSEWSRSEPSETVTVEREVIETGPWTEDPHPYVTADDFAAAYGLGAVTTAEDPPVDEVVTHTTAGDEAGRKLEVFVCDHRLMPGMAADDEANWRAMGPVTEVPGLGDSAFVTNDGTVFARVGDDWTVQVATGDWNPPVDQTVAFTRRVLARLETAPPPEMKVVDERIDRTSEAPPVFQDRPWPAPAPPTGGVPRSRRGWSMFVGVVLALVAVAGTVARVTESDDSEEASQVIVPDSRYDLIGEIAAEPERTLNAQGVTFRMTDHEAMSSTVCPPVPGCRRATRADFEVDGRPMVTRTWLLAFTSEGSAKYGAERLRDEPEMLDPDPPSGSFTIVFDPGRWVQLVRLTRTDGASVPMDDDTRSVLRGIGAISAESASVDVVRRLDR